MAVCHADKDAQPVHDYFIEIVFRVKALLESLEVSPDVRVCTFSSQILGHITFVYRRTSRTDYTDPRLCVVEVMTTRPSKYYRTR